MKELNNNQLEHVIGGLNISYSLINSFVRAIELAMEVGRSLGTAIRRLSGKSVCGMK